MQTKRLIRWYSVLVVIIIGFVVYITLKYNNVEQDRYRWDEIIKFNDGWTFTNDLGQLESIQIPIQEKLVKDKVYTLTNKLPNQLKEGSTLCFKSNHLHIKAYVDDVQVYSLNVDERSTISKSPGCSFVFIPLSSDMRGKTIRLEYKGVYKGASFHISDFFLGDKSTIITGIIRRNAIPILICSLIFCLGLIFIISYLIKRKTYDMNRSLLYLGIFALPMAVWSMTETQILQFFFKNPYALQYVTYLSLALCPVPFLLFYSEEHNLTKSKIVHFIGNGSIFIIVLCLVLQAFGIVDLPRTVIFVHISIALILGYALYHSIHEAIVGDKRRVRLSLTKFSMIFMLICCMVDLVRYYFIISLDYSKYLRIGFLLYLGCTGLGTIFRSVQIDKENKELEQLAYLDSVTGLFNSVAFEKKLEQLDTDTGFIEIEVLELDEIENELGLKAKNEILISTAKMMERAFHNAGSIFRYSEGKFIIMLNENIEETYSSGMQNLKKRLHNSNKSRGQKLYLADTFIMYDSKENQDIKNVIEELEFSLENVKKIKELAKA
ncbi:MAG: diguanylate cyclase [Clostridiales bacterium]|nr:diguanylate cyclase [Clostridiales bacterium]